MDSLSVTAINHILLSSTSTRKLTNPITLKTSCRPSTFFIRCSTKPHISSNNKNNTNPSKETDSNSIGTTHSTNQLPSRGLVLDMGSTNSWDSQQVGSPVVKRFISDEEERWYMWYHGSSDGTSDSIGLALSSNGVHWERGTGPVRSNAEAGLVLGSSKDWWAFDTASLRPSEVVIMSSDKVRASSAVYWLYYTGYSNSEEVDGEHKSLPGLAISQDGRHWARIEGEHYSGALFDVGAEAEWDSLFIAAPQVVFHTSGDLRMYYHSFDTKTEQFCIGIARSRDGIKWLKLGKIIGGGGSEGCFDELGVKNAHVVRNQKSGGYVMAYEGVAKDGKRSIGLAVSPDGLKNWTKSEEGAILKPCAEDGWDNKGVGSPCLVQMDGKDGEWRLYYKGVGIGGNTGIGMAVSGDGEITNFTRWEGFHL